MCEFERKLIAWIDGELEAGEALEIEHHARVCAACSMRAGEYRNVSRAFSDYCEAIATQRNSRRLPWVAWGAAAAVAALTAMVILMLRSPVEPFPFERPRVAGVPAMAFRTASVNRRAPAKLAHPRAALKRAENPQPRWNIEPSIEIAIPAEAVFAPGAVPPGFRFAAELSIAGDGSLRALWLRP